VAASVVAAARAYYRLDAETLPGLWDGVDGHWTQEGSDHFARLIEEILRDWPP